MVQCCRQAPYQFCPVRNGRQTNSGRDCCAGVSSSTVFSNAGSSRLISAAREPGNSRMVRSPARRIKTAARPLETGCDYILVRRQAVADIGRRRTAEARHDIRLERQHGKHMVDIAEHLLRAIFLPGPDTRTDVVDDRKIGHCGANALGDAMGEIRAVDDDKHVWPGSDDCSRRLANAGEQLRQLRDDLGERP